MSNQSKLSDAQIQQFKIDGYLVLPSTLSADELPILKTLTDKHLKSRQPPIELEAQVHYPGAPQSVRSEGGETIRRLLMVYRRDQAFAKIANSALVCNGIKQILRSQRVYLNPNHHNCMMTKQPEYSSKTLWHRDTRYWNFTDKYLVNAWFALGQEQHKNGAMQILPGSHRWEVKDDALDEAQFLKTEHSDNQTRLATARTIELQAGDAVLFSAHCFHAAGRNKTDRIKRSLVFTYHGEHTQPIEGSSSDKHAPIRLL